MRLTCTVLAVLMLAACPPRRSRVVYVQPCVVPAAPVVVVQTPSAPEPSPLAIDPAVKEVLAEWEKKMAGVSNLRVEIALKRRDAVSKKVTNYSGSLLWLKPSCARLRMDNADDPTKTDYEAYICDGKSIFVYNGVRKEITEIKLPLNSPQANEPVAKDPLQRWQQWLSRVSQSLLENSLVYQALIAMKAKDVKERFDITLFKKDEYYVYLDLKPRSDVDKGEFQRIRVALYGPGPATEKYAYLPAQVFVLKPSGETEAWKFSNPQVNIPSVNEKDFAFTPIKGWDFKKAPAPAEPAKP